MPVSVILTTLRKSSRFREALSKVEQSKIELHAHTPKSVLSKRVEPEKQIVEIALIKQETPNKCCAVHAGSLIKEDEDEVTCDLCPEPKKINTNKSHVKPSWFCNTCDFDFC